jgi:hypothetical protein
MSNKKWAVGLAFLYVSSAVLIGQAVLVGQSARAFSTGITTVSGNPSTGGINCNVCHSGGLAPTVTIEGPSSVAPGSTTTYVLRISGGQEVGGGLDVSATDGALSVADPGTYMRSGEITHSTPRPVDGNGEVLFSFNWTAPLAPGTATLYGAGNSVNLNGNNGGDQAANDVFAITIGTVAATPGETSGEALAPLLVTDYDPLTGDIALSYEAACETTDTNMYYGVLADVDSLTWSGEECAIGTSGTYSGFNPGTDSYFFVVVGTRGSDEGSYGTSFLPGGSTPERPPFETNTCGQDQTLDAACVD